MYTLDKFELFRTLLPILGKERTTVVVDIAAKELATEEQWIWVGNVEFSMAVKTGYFKYGEHEYVGENGDLYRSRCNERGFNEFFKLVKAPEGKPAKGWFGRVIYHSRRIYSISEEEGSMIFKAINNMVCADLGVSA